MNCQSISTSGLCSPWAATASVDLNALSTIYGSKLKSVEDWELALAQTSEVPQESDWEGCSPEIVHKVLYSTSYLCLTDLFVVSAECNKNVKKLRPLCHSACDEYAGSVDALFTHCSKSRAEIKTIRNTCTLYPIYSR